MESDVAAPLNAYGISKLAGEHFTAALASKHFVLRVSSIYGHYPCRAKGGLNFVELMLKLARERDEVRVRCRDLAGAQPSNQFRGRLIPAKARHHVSS